MNRRITATSVYAALRTAKTLAELYNQTRDRWETWQNGHNYTVSILSTDDIYPYVQIRLQKMLKPAQQRSLQALTWRTSNMLRALGETSSEQDSRTSKLLFEFDGSRPQRLHFEGHPVYVMTGNETVSEAGSDNPLPTSSSSVLRPPRLSFTSRTYAGQQAVRRFLQGVTDDYNQRTTLNKVRMAGKWGGWSDAPTGPARALDTVILRKGLLEDLVDDLTTFLDSEHRYSRLGLPWHRAYLFYGPPGTGKSSLAKSLAAHFDLDLFYLAMADLEKDTDLADVISNIKNRGILLLEDIDTLPAARARDEDEGEKEAEDTTGKVSMSGLFNALDGVITPHGLITIYTTNHRSALDNALLRPGRADRHFHLSYLDNEQLLRLVKLICPDSTPDPTWDPGDELTPATVIEWAKPHLDDLDAAFLAIEEHFRP